MTDSAERQVSAVALGGFDPPYVFRFFRREEDADALANGSVYLSTLEACRGYEQRGRGDPNEARHEYHADDIRIRGRPEDRLMAARFGIHIEGGGDVTIRNGVSGWRLPDAWLLCATERYRPDVLGPVFGEYCVRIDQPVAFWRAVTGGLLTRTELETATIGRVVYSSRTLDVRALDPAPLGFVKPPDAYAEQQEVRMLWMPPGRQLSLGPLLVSGPHLSQYCRRIA